MLKKSMAILVAAGVLISLAGCGSGEAGDSASTTGKSNSDSAFEIVEAEKRETKSFTEANVFEFTLENRDDQSYDEIIATFRITNTGEQAIDYLSVDFSYLDEGGNEICDDGRYNDYQIAPNTAVLMKSYSYLDGVEKSVITNIAVTSYEYRIGNDYYEVDLQTEQVDTWSYEDDSVVDFEAANIISFNCEGMGIEYDSYKVSVQIANNGSATITEVSYDMAYVDETGTLLDSDGRYSDSAITTGKFVSSKSYCTEESVVDLVSGFGVYAYEYDLAEVDENGYNHYEINLQTKTATGYLYEY